MDLGLKDKVAIVGGASKGLGKACAQVLAKEGAKVAICSRSKPDLERAAEEISSASNSDVMTFVGDLDKHQTIQDLIVATVARFGRLDIMVNNSGGPPLARAATASEEQWETALQRSLLFFARMCREAVPHLKHQGGGRIINNGSISAHTPRPDSAPYTTTKHAMTGLTKSTALDGRKYDIACGQIDIGNAETPMTARMKAGVAQPNGTTEIEPTMDAANVGGAVRYMADLPLDANALFMTVMATKMPYVGRG